MENFDSLFSNQQQCSEQPFDKKQWAQQKQEKRQELYDTIDKMADRTLSEPEMLAAYIKTQARLGMTSVANTLLIAAQKPEASYVMSYDDWTQKGRSVKRGENGFFILEANGEYNREDGLLRPCMTQSACSTYRRLTASPCSKEPRFPCRFAPSSKPL